MTSHLKRAVLLLFEICLFASGCGGDSTPTTPGGSGGGNPSGQVCRIYPTSATAVETNGSGNPASTLTTTYTSAFNPSTNQLTTSANVTASNGCAGAFTAVSTWDSVADFIAEVSVIPPVQRLTRAERSEDACAGKATTLTYTYDAQHRLSQTQPGGISYLAWDGFGRPAAAVSISGANQTSWSFSYDNAARIKTQTSTLNGGAPTVVTTTFDVNGNTIGVTGAGTTVVTTVRSTATVCR